MTTLKIEDVITQVSYEEENETIKLPYSSTEAFLRKIFCCFPRRSTRKRKKETNFTNIFKNNAGVRIETDDDEMVLMNEEEDATTEKKRTKEPLIQATQLVPVKELSPPINFENSLLGPPSPALAGRKTLVLDLDETLVHSSFKKGSSADIIVNVEIEGFVNPVFVLKRPGVDEFLRQMGQIYEVVIFTASLAKYANPLLDQLDKDKVIHHRLFREHCTYVDGAYKKDLSKLGRDISQVIIIDNSPICYDLQPQNAIPVSSWFDDRNDRELYALVPWLQKVSLEKDVYGVLSDIQMARRRQSKT